MCPDVEGRGCGSIHPTRASAPSHDRSVAPSSSIEDASDDGLVSSASSIVREEVRKRD
jgi:hypothetical protein